MQVAVVVVSIALAALFGIAGFVNILYLEKARHESEHLQISPRLSRFVGMCQLTGAIGLSAGLFWPVLGAAAAVGLMLLMVGAVVVHRRVGDSARAALPAVVVCGVAGVVVAGQLILLVG
ncbi:DoxX family protein [Mycolicibacterium fortuitum]|uniref:DoxX family protein n=1 Tax=Mycolicibacterium fortuitum TaxID=1766 RepID=UPI001AEF92C8|nr:DoxX family protein [Mycolicibacterium fortuitum]MBP3086594.1 DoxX family protein [Mycolicibacterium fortuitum]